MSKHTIISKLKSYGYIVFISLYSSFFIIIGGALIMLLFMHPDEKIESMVDIKIDPTNSHILILQDSNIPTQEEIESRKIIDKITSDKNDRPDEQPQPDNIIKPEPPTPVYDPSIPYTRVSEHIPKQAYHHIDTLIKEIDRLLPNIDYPEYFGGLIEHESCITLRHSRCWNPKSRLKTAREEGAGLGQLTRAYRSSGELRFDSLTELRKRHMSELRELSWNNIYNRPDLQIRAIILMTTNNLNSLHMVNDNYQKLSMADAAYNGGLGGLNNERRACGLAAGCDPQYWFDNIENYCLKSKKILYANRSACDINRHHVKDVMITRMPKYKKFFI